MKLVVVVLAVLLLVWLLLGSSRRRGRAARRDDSSARSPSQADGLVACAHCGVHLPGSLALHARGQTYCSAAHRDAGPRAS
jgi:uncharacterized protein